MSGERELENQYITKKIDEVEKQIEALKIQYGLNNITFDTEIENILNYSWNELEKLTPMECLRYTYIINQYLTALRLSISKYKSIRNFCKNAFNIVVSQEYKNFKIDYSSPEITIYSIVRNNAYAKVLNERIVEIETNIEMLEPIIPVITNTLNVFKNMSYIKREQEHELN